MVTVKAPIPQQPRSVSKPSSPLYLKLVMIFFVMAALAVYLNVTLFHRSSSNNNIKTSADIDNSSTPVFTTNNNNDSSEEWWYMKKWELEDWLECWDVYEQGRPVHSHDDWVALRNAYRQVVGEEHSSLLPNDDINGFGNVQVIANVSPGKGRGVFATQHIHKGTLVWTSRHQSAQFKSGLEFRTFLTRISREMACDVLMWAYVHDVGTDEQHKYRISCDLDEGSFINSARFEDAEQHEGDEANIGCIDEFDDDYIQEYLHESADSGCPENLFALRDIKAGEEILCVYADFALQSGWKKFGL